ncbi:MAG: HD domain-containing protein [Clostridium sp.]|nr:HD domain-containing protein [Clostridium sp.]
MNIKLPNDVLYIINKIESAGHEVFVVGGAIRDILIGKYPNDYDLTTSAKPQEIIDLFEKSILTGVKHGTVTIPIEGSNYDITTYRVESAYVNKRAPENVTFTKDIYEDLLRRDFTINSIAYNPNKRLVDPFNGLEDLNKRTIKTVGNPNERFDEDALRMLRAIRFATTLNYNLDPKTSLSIVENAENLKYISKERIRNEINTILISDYPKRGLKMISNLGLLKYIFPSLIPLIAFNQFNRYHDENVFDHSLEVVANTPKHLHTRLAALFHDSGKPDTFTVDKNGAGHFYGHEMRSSEITIESLKHLKYDNKTISNVYTLVKNHMVSVDIKKENKIKKLIKEVGEDNLDSLISLKRADISAKRSDIGLQNKDIDLFKDKIYNILNSNEPLSIKDLAINGNDIMSLGIKEGIEIGKILAYLLEKVLDNPSLNTKEKLIDLTLRHRKEK